MSSSYVWCLLHSAHLARHLARHGVPTMRNFDGTRRPGDAMSHAALMNSQLDQSLDWDVIDWLRARWRGPGGGGCHPGDAFAMW